MILLTLMIVGACAGSTAGGLKISRLTVLLKRTNWTCSVCCIRRRSMSSRWIAR
ncbi:MAG: hypothetical protein ACLVJ6_01670 [Merdibacter sp.]